MKYITIVAKDFEEAVKKARDQYGPALRIHSRRDVIGRGGFLWLGKRTHVELTCYLVDPVKQESPSSEIKTPMTEETTSPGDQKEVTEGFEDPKKDDREELDGISDEPSLEADEIQSSLKHEQLLEHAHVLLRENDFSEGFTSEVLDMLRSSLDEFEPEEPSTEEFELMLVDKIVSLVTIDHETQLRPPKIFILLGPTGIGKTTTTAKIAALYNLQQDPEFHKSVHMISIDSFRVGAFEQLAAFGSSLGIPVGKVSDEQEFYHALSTAAGADLILVDTIGKSPRDKDLAIKMKALLSVPDKDECGYYLAISGAMKTQDVARTIDQYTSFGITSIIITKMDETETVGNVLSVCHDRGLPILFFTDGQRVPKDIHKASASTMLGQLRGFSLDFQHLWINQAGPDPVVDPGTQE